MGVGAMSDETPAEPAPSAHDFATRYRSWASRAPEEGLDLFELFPQTSEIEMEIGFGRGLFLRQRAGRVPQHGLLGIEIKNKWAYLVEQRAKADGLGNVRVFAGDAREILLRLRPAGALARVFIHFPDPWWKKKQQKRSVVCTATLDALAPLLRPGGELFVQTDVKDRADAHHQLLSDHPGFELGEAGGWLEANPYGAVSNREARAAQDGLPVYRLLARRRA
jgi:tRNA (guanine-N7-)-methyltransferase